MNNLINAIELQQEKLEALKMILKNVRTDDHTQSTSKMLKDLKQITELLLLSDF